MNSLKQKMTLVRHLRRKSGYSSAPSLSKHNARLYAQPKGRLNMKKPSPGSPLTNETTSPPSSIYVISSAYLPRPSVQELISLFHKAEKRLEVIKTPRGKHRMLSVPEVVLREMVNVELFNIAQGIGSLTVPDIQQTLDDLRRAVLAEINNQQKVHDFSPRLHQGHPVAFTPRGFKYTKWEDIQITPEFAFDSTITGLKISSRLAKKLIVAHKMQIASIIRRVRKM